MHSEAPHSEVLHSRVLRFGVLGPLTVWTTEDRAVEIPGRKARALLADLLARPGQLVPADQLIDDLWHAEKLPADPGAALHTTVWQLRRTLAAADPQARELIVRRDIGYLLQVQGDRVDASRFEALVSQARASTDPAARARILSDALALWRADAFLDHRDSAFLEPVVARLTQTRLTARELLAQAHLDLGRYDDVVHELAAVIEQHPLREPLWAIQIRALYLAGRVAEALACYQDLRTRLADELGLDPAPELRALHRAVLERDPGLGAAAIPAQPPTEYAPAQDNSGHPPADETLRSANGTVPQHRTTAHTDDPRGDRTHPSTNLPSPLTPLIGREDAVEAVTALLATSRQVTLTGTGGVGKTRLALATAQRLTNEFPDGIRLVELASIGRAEATDPVARVVEAIMTVLDIREKFAPAPARPPDLLDGLRDKQLLLVLDNCEHLVTAVAEIAHRLLEQAPRLHILATSQEPIGIAGETIWPVPPLDVPAADTGDAAAMARASAVRLFVARAAAATPGFAPTPDTLAAIATICRRLDGIPLALELAATRVRALGVAGLLDRLDDRFRLLTTGYRSAPTRQRTLRAMIDWSWELLSEPERVLLRRLSVFVDGCTLEAAELVCGYGALRTGDVLELLARLVDRSLVIAADTADGIRYRLFESVADYGDERLREAGEYERLHSRHRDHFVRIVERAAPLLQGIEQRHWLRLLDAEAANLRRAQDDIVRDGRSDLALRLVGGLAWYWYLRGRFREAVRSFAAALALDETAAGRGRAPESAAKRNHAGAPRRAQSNTAGRGRAPEGAVAQANPARALLLAGHLGFSILVGARIDQQALRQVSEGLTGYLADPNAAARARWFLGFALFGVGDQLASEELIAQALSEFEALGDTWGIAAALTVRANQAHVRGDLAALARDGRRSAALFLELGDQWGTLQTVEPLAALAEMTGDYPLAERLQRDGLRSAQALGMWPDAVERLTGLGSIAMLTGDHPLAREYHTRARELAVEHTFKSGEVRAEMALGLGARRAGRLDLAESHLRAALRWLTEISFTPGIALALAELGFLAELRGDAATALRLHREGWTAACATGDIRAVALALEGLAGAHALAGAPREATLLLGAAHAARDSVELPLPPGERGDVDRIIRTVRDHLDEPTYTATFRRGLTYTPAAAVAESSAWSAGRVADGLRGRRDLPADIEQQPEDVGR